MSDLYDSLEDDSVEHNSSKSLSGRKSEPTDSCRRTRDSTNSYSFYLNENLKNERKDQLKIFSPSTVSSEKLVTLPKIECRSREKGLESVLNIVVDNKSLQEQGLQFNIDGSFTKSPRKDIEELPFITREYRNLQFQRKKTYSLNKNMSIGAYPKKKAPIFEVEAETKPNMTQLRKLKKRSEELLPNQTSVSFKSKLSRKHSEKDKNLTDSMKEKLLQTCKRDQEKDAKRVASHLKAKQEINSIESPQPGKDSTLKKKICEVVKPQNLGPRENSLKSELNGKRKSKSIPQTISKYKSDILLSTRKSKLNYSERYQLENGYNPLSLRQENKKVLNDTDRSNFGDSVVEDLPEVSSRVLSCDNSDLGGEDEEMFYRKLIERDKNLRQTLLSSRSEGPLETLKITGLNNNKGQKESKTLEKVMKSKSNSKSLCIDMPSECRESVCKPKKCNHYCSANTSPKISKTELALKAKTYGFFVNARNIYKLKGRRSSTEREKNSENVGKIASPVEKLRKQNSLPSNGFPKVKQPLLGNYPTFQRTVKVKQQPIAEGILKKFALPQVNGSPELGGGKMSTRVLERINSLLVGPHV